MKYYFFLITFLIFTNCNVAFNHSRAGWEYLNKNNYDAAIAEFDAAFSHDSLPGTYLGYIKACLGKGNAETAYEYLARGLKKHPDDEFLLVTAGHIYEMQRNFCEALLFYRRANKTAFGKVSNSMYKRIEMHIKSMEDSIRVNNITCSE